jgi:hypothetical protein
MKFGVGDPRQSDCDPLSEDSQRDMHAFFGNARDLSGFASRERLKACLDQRSPDYRCSDKWRSPKY